MAHPARPSERKSLSCWGLLRPLVLFVLASGVALQLPARGQEPKPAGKADNEGSSFLAQEEQVRLGVTAVAILGMTAAPGGEAAALGTVLHPNHSNVWTGEDVPPLKTLDMAPVLLRSMLADVQDSTKILDANDKHRFALEEHAAYNYVLYEAHRTPQAAFHKSARTDVTCIHLMNQPKKFRGEVVHLERWRLRRLLRYDDPPPELRLAGLKEFYEGWMFNTKHYGTNPVCVIFTDLPRGLKVGEALDVPVSFDGYFFKKYRYKAADNNDPREAREAPLFIGHTLTMLDPVDEDDASASSSWNDVLLTGFMALIILTVVFLLGLTWWFRRSDRQVRERLARQQTGGRDASPAAWNDATVMETAPPVLPAYPVEGANGGNGHTAETSPREGEFHVQGPGIISKS